MRAGQTDSAGKVAFVAGGYGGIGEAVAHALARRGATVVIAGRDAAKAQALAGDVARTRRQGSDVALDARDVASIRDAVAAAAARHGGIDFLVNCAGTQQIEPLVDVTEEAFDRVLDVNLKAAMFLAQAVARVQIAAGRGGRHVHLLSVRAQLGMRDRGYSAYCSSKGGLVQLVKQHAVELARHGINVNGVAPTVVRTPMASDWLERSRKSTAADRAHSAGTHRRGRRRQRTGAVLPGRRRRRSSPGRFSTSTAASRRVSQRAQIS